MAKSLIGTVTSNKTDKTIVVTVHTHKTHPIYKKQYPASKNFMAHDEKNEAKIGDKVLIEETKPLSARKRHILKQILNKATIAHDQTVEAITAEPKEAETEAKK